MRVLVVEDDATIASFVGKGLREAGFAVDIAADGQKGLELALAQPYDAAVVDVMLPGPRRPRPGRGPCGERGDPHARSSS